MKTAFVSTRGRNVTEANVTPHNGFSVQLKTTGSGTLRAISRCVAGAGLLLLSAGAFGGCSGAETDAGAAENGDEENLESSQEAITYADGYHYVPSGQKAMYRLYDGNKYCWVYDMGQHDALMNRSRASYAEIGMPDHAYFVSLMNSQGRQYTGSCEYPTGCYRRWDNDAIFYLDKDSHYFCWLRSDAQRYAYCPNGSFLNIRRSMSEIDFKQDGYRLPSSQPPGSFRAAARLSGAIDPYSANDCP